MSTRIDLNYSRNPSPFLSLIKAALGASKRFSEEHGIPLINATRKEVKIDKKHLKKFLNFCKLPEKETIPLLYPYSFTYPIMMRILTEKRAPLSMFKTLNVRSRTTRYRPIYIDDVLNINSSLDGWRIVEKGLEVDITTQIHIDNEKAWENITTFYYRGRFGNSDCSIIPIKLDPIQDAPSIAEWFLTDGIGYPFSKIIGDNNGIHYWSWYARMFGFKRDFAQPVLILGNSIGLLPEMNPEKPVQLDVLLKGPIYYNNKVFIRGTSDNSRFRFDIYCGNETRPGFCCDLKQVNL